MHTNGKSRLPCGELTAQHLRNHLQVSVELLRNAEPDQRETPLY